MLKLFIYGYLNRVQSSRRLEREACRNLEVMMWLTGRLGPDPQNPSPISAKTTALPSRRSARNSLHLCRKMGLLAKARCCDRRQQVQGGQFARQQLHEGKMERRLAQIEESVAHYLSQRRRRSPDSFRRGAVGGACGQDHAAQGEADQARRRG